jgi:hypothetical protein
LIEGEGGNIALVDPFLISQIIVSYKIYKFGNFSPLDVYLPESRFPFLGEFVVEDEYLDVVKVKRPYSLEVGIFKGIVELNI